MKSTRLCPILSWVPELWLLHMCSLNPDSCTCDSQKWNVMSLWRPLFGIPGHKLACSFMCFQPPQGLPVFSPMSPLRSIRKCTWPQKETRVEEAQLTALPHTVLPVPPNLSTTPELTLCSQRKSPFPEAITLGTLRSGLKCDSWARTGTSSASHVCAAAKSNTYGWAASGMWVVVDKVVGENYDVFSASPLTERTIFFFLTARHSRLTSLRTIMCLLVFTLLAYPHSLGILLTVFKRYSNKSQGVICETADSMHCGLTEFDIIIVIIWLTSTFMASQCYFLALFIKTASALPCWVPPAVNINICKSWHSHEHDNLISLDSLPCCSPHCLKLVKYVNEPPEDRSVDTQTSHDHLLSV